MNDSTDIRLKAAEVRIEHLSKAFGDHTAVQDVSLLVSKGDFYTFLGPSGCGKTTLLRMIAGFETPDSGEILIDGERINDVPPWSRDVGMVFQNFALWPHLSVHDNIAFGLKERRLARSEIQDRVQRALVQVDLDGLGDRRPSQLSGGQQQRVALARTLVVQPRCLLLDEPLSSLDARLRIQMREELVRLQQDLGITTIYVTHDQEEALALSTRVAVFSVGSVVQEGTPREIYERPQDRAVADFVGTSNILRGSVDRVEGDRAILDCAETGNIEIAVPPPPARCPVAGEPVLIHVRPESLRISRASESDQAGEIRGTVRSSAYLGAAVHVEVETEAGTTLMAAVTNPRRFAGLPAGTSVAITFSPEDAVLLPED